MTERDLDRSPAPSDSLLPVGGVHRKLNGHCVWPAGNDDVVDAGMRGDNGDALAASVGATGCSFDDACVPNTSRVSDDIEMTRHLGAAAASDCMNLIYIDTKGADDNSSLGVCHNSQHGTCCEAGTRTPTSLFANGSRSTYTRVADNCSLPPEVEQLRRDYVVSSSASSDAHRTAGKFDLWEFVACAVVMSLVVPFCGIPALFFAVRSQVFYRHGDMNASRAANLTALRLITAAGVCLCLLAVTASVLIAVFNYDDRPPTQSSIPTGTASAIFAGSAARQRPQGTSLSSNAFEKALERHAHEALNKQPRTMNNRHHQKQSGGFGKLIGNIGQAQFSVHRSTVSPTESGLMRRLRTWNG